MEKTHRWSLGNSSKIKFKFKFNDIDINNINGILKLYISTLGKQKITILINNNNVGTQIVNSSDIHIAFHFNPNILKKNRINIIEFKLPDAHKPSNGDKRILAIALKSLVIE